MQEGPNITLTTRQQLSSASLDGSQVRPATAAEVLDEQDKEIHALGEALDRLEANLESVLAPEEPRIALDQGLTPGSPAAPLVNRLAEHNTRLACLSGRVVTLDARLGL